MAPPSINTARLLETVEQLSRFGLQPDGGLSRFTLTEADIQARRYIIELMKESGLQVRLDAFANIIGRLEGSRSNAPTILCGSHIDTVPHGGKLDGAYGVLSSVEALRTIHEQRLGTKAPLEAVVFTEEEGVRFPSFIGSMGFTGALPAQQAHALRDQNGTTFGDALARSGITSPTLSRAHTDSSEVGAYVELHIEQGPILEQERVSIGAVTSIVGLADLTIELEGTAGHAGTTPMTLRSDPMLAASRIILRVNELARQSSTGSVATVGSVSVSPNAYNVIPGKVKLGIDYRDPTVEGLESLQEQIISMVKQVAAQDSLKVKIESTSFTKPAKMSPRVIDAIVASAHSLGLKHKLMHSGAGHDCQNMAQFTDAGMIFVPSREGVSHNVREYSADRELEAGANVLLNTIMQLANE